MKGSQKDFDQDLSHKRTLSRCRHCLFGRPIFGSIWQQWKASRQAFPIILNCYNVIVSRWHRIQATFDVWKSMQSFGCCQYRCVLESLDLRFLRLLCSSLHTCWSPSSPRTTTTTYSLSIEEPRWSHSLKNPLHQTPTPHIPRLLESCVYRCATPLRPPSDLEAPP